MKNKQFQLLYFFLVIEHNKKENFAWILDTSVILRNQYAFWLLKGKKYQSEK